MDTGDRSTSCYVWRGWLHRTHQVVGAMLTPLVNLAKHFGVVKEVVAQLVDALGHGAGHGVGPWDGVGGVAKRWAVSPCDRPKVFSG